MISDEDKVIELHSKMSSEDVSGAKVGFAIISVMSVCMILGIALPIFCPQTYKKLEAIIVTITQN